jgi:hypothetical protein
MIIGEEHEAIDDDDRAAVVDLMAEEALAAADRADKAVKDGEPLGILHVVPVTVKINIDYAGRALIRPLISFTRPRTLLTASRLEIRRVRMPCAISSALHRQISYLIHHLLLGFHMWPPRVLRFVRPQR